MHLLNTRHVDHTELAEYNRHVPLVLLLSGNARSTAAGVTGLRAPIYSLACTQGNELNYFCSFAKNAFITRIIRCIILQTYHSQLNSRL